MSPRLRWALVVGVAVAGAIAVVLLIVFHPDDQIESSGRAVSSRRATTTTTKKPTTTTTTPVTSTSTSTSTTTGGVGVAPGQGVGVADGVDPPEPVTPTDPSQGGVTVAESPGACRFDPVAGVLEDSGTLHNPTGEEAVVEVQVTWSNPAGELDSWSDLVTVPAGGTADWSVSTARVEVPVGLTCQTALI